MQGCWQRQHRERAPAVGYRRVEGLLEGRIGAGRSAVAGLQAFRTFSDPEGLYLWAQIAAGLGDTENAIGLLNRAVETGFYATQGLEVSAFLAPVRADSRFTGILDRARAGHRAASRAFIDADGPRLLGLTADAG